MRVDQELLVDELKPLHGTGTGSVDKMKGRSESSCGGKDLLIHRIITLHLYHLADALTQM